MSVENSIANQIIRESFRKDTRLRHFTNRNLLELRSAIQTARRFELDESMSAFLADLSCTPFRVAPERRGDTLKSILHSAKLPFPKIWLEIDGRAFRRRMVELNDGDSFALTRNGPAELVDDSEVLPRFAYLVEEDSKDSNLIRITEFTGTIPGNIIHKDTPPATFGLSWLYRTDDLSLPSNLTEGNQIAHGITNFDCKQVGIEYTSRSTESDKVELVFPTGETIKVSPLAMEIGGGVRYVACLLATLADIPMTKADTTLSKGYLARGQYRKYLNHSVLKINLPAKTTPNKLAKKLIAITRRRRHEVRGYWRKRVGQNTTQLCVGPHIWSSESETHESHCTKCGLIRKWIAPHERGDATLGYVTHEYVLGHS
jgi:hypothetical protein